MASGRGSVTGDQPAARSPRPARSVPTALGRPVPAAAVDSPAELARAVSGLGLAAPRPVLALVGGAGRLEGPALEALRPLFEDVVVPVVQASGATVVDGATSAGVIDLMGRARAARRASFALVGVVVERLVTEAGGAPIEPHHTHLVLVPGADWGDESPWLAEVAGLLAGGCPSVTLLVEGGAIAWADVGASVGAARPVIALRGSGRTADELAAAIENATAATPGVAGRLAASGLVEIVDVDDGTGVGAALTRALASGGST